MSNTAIEQLIDDFVESGNRMAALNAARYTYIMYQQIVDAYNQGYRDGESDALNTHNADIDVALCSNAEDYFNEKYGQP